MKDVEVKIDWNGALVDEVKKAALRGLKKGALLAAGEAMEVCPEETGTLKRSITVSEGGSPNADMVYRKAQTSTRTKKPNDEGKQGEELSVYITANTPYAHKQHENNRTKPKFLEKGLQAAAQRTVDMVSKEIKKELR